MTLACVRPPFDADGDRVDTVVGGVLLAAGSSTRFGRTNKLLATLDGAPIVRHAAESLAAATTDLVVVVVRPDADDVRDALAGLPVEFVSNSDADAGQSASVRTGLRALSERIDADAALFALGDMPRVRVDTVDLLVRAHRAGAGTALAASYGGRRGNPVVFDARHFDALLGIDGDVGGRAVIQRAASGALVETGDPGVIRDVDTPTDLRGLRDD